MLSYYESIAAALRRLYSKEFQFTLEAVQNHYGKGGASELVVETLTKIQLEDVLKKYFFNLNGI